METGLPQQQGSSFAAAWRRYIKVMCTFKPGRHIAGLQLPMPFNVWETPSYLPVISPMVWA